LVDQRSAERQRNRDPGDHERQVVPDEDLQEHGQPSEQPDVARGERLRHRIRAAAHQRDDDPDHDGDRLRDDGEQHGVDQTEEHHPVHDEVGHRSPVDPCFGERDEEPCEQADDHDGTDPAAPVPEPNYRQRLGRCVMRH
jgi:hypothetical protein